MLIEEVLDIDLVDHDDARLPHVLAGLIPLAVVLLRNLFESLAARDHSLAVQHIRARSEAEVVFVLQLDVVQRHERPINYVSRLDHDKG